jgi:hypothetical protein
MLNLPEGLYGLVEHAAINKFGPEEAHEYLQGEVYQQTMDGLTSGAVFTSAAPLYRLPLFTPEFCDHIIDRACSRPYEVNEEEEEPVQIPELVLSEKDPELYELLMELMPELSVWTMLAYNTEIEEVGSIQLARYTPDSVAGGNWHHDKDSDVSFVVSLNPENFEGGGTEVRTSLTGSIIIPPLPKGWALMFPGRLVQHRGLSVTKGQRDLLVFWLKV